MLHKFFPPLFFLMMFASVGAADDMNIPLLVVTLSVLTVATVAYFRNIK